MNGSKLFKSVEVVNPRRSGFSMASEHKTMIKMGYLYPVFTEDCVPGDKIKISTAALLRLQPLVAPPMHEVSAFLHFFFCPYRKLWDGESTGDTAGESWESFVTGGEDGLDNSVPPVFTPSGTASTAKGTLWDYFGHPVNEALDTPQTSWYTTWVAGGSEVSMLPRAWQWRAYNWVYNNYYRDENLQPEVSLDGNTVLARAWEKDYFTAALPWQQRGTAPGVPVTLDTLGAALFDGFPAVVSGEVPAAGQGLNSVAVGAHTLRTTVDTGVFSNTGVSRTAGYPPGTDPVYPPTGAAVSPTTGYGLNDNTVSISGPNEGSILIQALREVAAIQQWMERNARGGVRYTEFLQVHFGVKPEDYRLQRPEYIGGNRWPIITSEVLQTSGTGITDQESPQGNMAGHGLGFVRDFTASYYCREYGIVIGILSVMVRPAYQQGIRRNWRKLSRFDYLQTEFVHLSEQPILTGELYSTGNPAVDNDVFGYQGQYDEYRYKPSIVTSDMRDTFSYWHFVRQFGSQPLLNSSFISAADTPVRPFAVQSDNTIFAQLGFNLTAVRPLPYRAIPGIGRI